jgi:replicative DNA helicase
VQTLPHNIDAEKQVIGAILMDTPEYNDLIFAVLSADDFYLAKHTAAFEACRGLYLEGKSTNYISVKDRIGAGVDGDYLIDLMGGTLSASNSEHYAQIVKDYSTKRKLIVAAHNVIKQTADPSVSAGEIITAQDNMLFKLLEGTEKKYQHIREISIDALNKFQEAYHSKTGIIGLPCYFRDIDENTAGFRPQDLIYIAAATSVGKTAFALNIALNMAEHSIPVGYFSMEMSSSQIWTRLVSLKTKINSFAIQSGKLEQQDAERVVRCDVHQYPIYVDDSGGMSVAAIRNKARIMVKREGVSIIFVDHVGFVQAGEKFKSRNDELGFISSRLKQLAKELNIPVVALCQLNRDSVRKQQEPQLFDLRDSGNLEQDADVIFMIFRPERSGIASYTVGEKSYPTAGMALIKLEKHRNGPLARMAFHFDDTCGRFSAYDEHTVDLY